MGRPPSINELADELGEEPESIIHAMEASRTPESLFREYEDEDGSENRLIDRIAAQDNDKESDTVEKYRSIVL